jgi:mono/diheme cytochrome c family protein
MRMHSSTHAALLAVAAASALGAVSGCGGSKSTVASTTVATTTAATTTSGGGQVASGAQLFSDNCESCHGPMGAGGHVGPNLQKSSVAEHLAAVEAQIRHGGGVMPAFSGVLSKAQIDAVAHYVVEQIAPKA